MKEPEISVGIVCAHEVFAEYPVYGKGRGGQR